MFGWTAFSETLGNSKNFRRAQESLILDIWPHLTKKRIVVFTRKIGNAKLFRLNEKKSLGKRTDKNEQDYH